MTPIPRFRKTCQKNRSSYSLSQVAAPPQSLAQQLMQGMSHGQGLPGC